MYGWLCESDVMLYNIIPTLLHVHVVCVYLCTFYAYQYCLTSMKPTKNRYLFQDPCCFNISTNRCNNPPSLVIALCMPDRSWLTLWMGGMAGEEVMALQVSSEIRPMKEEETATVSTCGCRAVARTTECDRNAVTAGPCR